MVARCVVGGVTLPAPVRQCAEPFRLVLVGARGETPGWLTRQYQHAPRYPVRFWGTGGAV